ncbi:MAG: 16S rRNA (cytidine(1402)-2'-O)-methyltransferase [Alphaproteobacteria bacterium]|nr:16S rRNA (cytidine(1402)-2'-O)-methyltransferase [Alphaproteobacteria bacterium]
MANEKTQAQPSGQKTESKLLPGLYIVATPIGNIRDITLRALDILANVDILVCEDTRVTQKLLRAYDITAAKIFPYHEHNAEIIRPKLMERLRAGETIALTSDAGTPLVSDPGYKLVREAAAENIAVYAVPGASASLAALVSAGLPTDRFLFAGFLPSRRTARRQSLQEVAAIPASLIFYESARRLAESLKDMAELFGPRPAAVARELTKLYEEIRRGPLDELAAHYAVAGAPKGEVVIVVGAPGKDLGEVDIDGMLREALRSMSLRDAAATVSEASGQPRRKVYARALELLKGGEVDGS